MVNYEYLKDLAKSQKTKVENMIALSPANDPFYVGKPNDLAIGEWFAAIWRRFGYSTGVHLRRVHYQIISQSPPVQMPNGKPYENTESCWDYLGQASKMARYLGLVDPAAFVDRRNHAPIINSYKGTYDPDISVYTMSDESAVQLPEFPELPTYSLYGFAANQKYLLEIWAEKTTMDDVLSPLCNLYGVNLVRGVGEMSITATLDLVQRIKADGRPARIFYISDFDPAGKSMPVAVSRKMEFFVRQTEDEEILDIRLFPIVLTEEQVKRYRLPRTPIKETEMRRAGFEERFGAGATELDALEALRPGELARIVRQHITSYYDRSLNGRVEDRATEVRAELAARRQAVLDEHAEEIEQLRDEYDSLKAEFEEKLRLHSEARTALFELIEDDLEDARPDVEDFPVPEPEDGEEIGDGLYNSDRDYEEQLLEYRIFQGKAEAEE